MNIDFKQKNIKLKLYDILVHFFKKIYNFIFIFITYIFFYFFKNTYNFILIFYCYLKICIIYYLNLSINK